MWLFAAYIVWEVVNRLFTDQGCDGMSLDRAWWCGDCGGDQRGRACRDV